MHNKKHPPGFSNTTSRAIFLFLIAEAILYSGFFQTSPLMLSKGFLSLFAFFSFFGLLGLLGFFGLFFLGFLFLALRLASTGGLLADQPTH